MSTALSPPVPPSEKRREPSHPVPNEFELLLGTPSNPSAAPVWHNGPQQGGYLDQWPPRNAGPALAYPPVISGPTQSLFPTIS